MSRCSDRMLIIDNSEIYRYYRERLVNIALAQFEYHGLPETVDRLFLEKSFLFNGKACFIKQEGTDIWLGVDFVTRNGCFDVYGYPTDIRGIGYGPHTRITGDEWEIAYDNNTFASLMPMIDLYARLLWEVHNTFRSNLQQQITPYMVLTDRKSSLSMKNLFNRIRGFDPVIEVRNNMDLNTIQTIDTRVNYIGKDLLDSLKVIWAEALSMLGITAETTKKERMITDELSRNNMEQMLSLNSRLLNRMELINKMNKRHGWNASVNLSVMSPDDITFPGDYAMAALSELKGQSATDAHDDVNLRGNDNG